MPHFDKAKILIRRGWQFATQKHDHPPPKSAAKPFPKMLAEPTPGGTRPAPVPQSTPEPAPIDRAPAKARAADRTPEETARLERGAELRREMHADRLARARDGLAQEHKAAAERLSRQLDDARAQPIVRLAAEGELAMKQHDDVGALETGLSVLTVAVEEGIREAYEAGHFSDPIETMLATAFEHAAGHEGGHGDDTGGRGLGD